MNQLLVCLTVLFALHLPLMTAAQDSALTSRDDAVATRLAIIRDLAADADVVDALKKQNAKARTLQQIRAVEIGWVIDADRNPNLYRLINSECADNLRRLVSSDPTFREIMIMDDQGALVCATAKTSDYWQGDESKWIKAFDGGRGAVFVDEPALDQSTDAVLVQMSIPIMDGDRAIGVLTAGVEAKSIGR